MKVWFTLLIIVISFSSYAGDILRHTKKLELSQHTLLVTHTSRIFIEDKALNAGVDRWVKNFKDQNLPVVYLMNEDDESDSNWITQDRDPTYAVYSFNGAHEISIKTKELTVTGGFFTLCFDRTVESIIANAKNKKLSSLIINMPLEAIYDDKSIFMANMNLNFQEMEFFFSIKGHKTLKFFKNNLSRRRFIHGLKVFFEYKTELSYEVYMDGNRVLKHHLPNKKLIKINLI